MNPHKAQWADFSDLSPDVPETTAQLLRSVLGCNVCLSNPEPHRDAIWDCFPATPSHRAFTALIHCSNTARRVLRSGLTCLPLKTPAETLPACAGSKTAQGMSREWGNEGLSKGIVCAGWRDFSWSRISTLGMAQKYKMSSWLAIWWLRGRQRSQYLPLQMESQSIRHKWIFQGHYSADIQHSSLSVFRFPFLSEKLPTIAFPFFIDWESSDNAIHDHEGLNYGNVLLIHQKVIINKDY